MIRILIVEDHALVRQGFGRLITETDDMEVVAEAASVAEAIDHTAECKPDVIVLDVNLGQETSEGLLEALVSDDGRPYVLAVSMDADPMTVRRLLRLGAAGFIPKEEAAECLVDSIRALVENGEADRAQSADTPS